MSRRWSTLTEHRRNRVIESERPYPLQCPSVPIRLRFLLSQAPTAAYWQCWRKRFAFEPINLSTPTTITRITANITAYSAMSCPILCPEPARKTSHTVLRAMICAYFRMEEMPVWIGSGSQICIYGTTDRRALTEVTPACVRHLRSTALDLGQSPHCRAGVQNCQNVAPAEPASFVFCKENLRGRLRPGTTPRVMFMPRRQRAAPQLRKVSGVQKHARDGPRSYISGSRSAA